MPKLERIVVKVGGSLYELPSLRADLLRIFASLPDARLAIFPGGGGLADSIRELDKIHGLGEEQSHWLAVRSLSVAAHLLVNLLAPQAKVVTNLTSLNAVWQRGLIGIVDPLLFARSDARRKDALPRTWHVTSDSLALRLAQQWQFSRLILLKSTTPPSNWLKNGPDDFVDDYFKSLWQASTPHLEVSALNLRVLDQ